MAVKMIKIGVTMCAGVVAILIGWFAFRGQGKADNEIYVLPNDYEGAVIVLMNEPEGKPKRYDREGNRVYEIPSSGVLKTRFELERGNRNVIYKRKNGEELKYLWSLEKLDSIRKGSKNFDNRYVFGKAYAEDVWFFVGNPFKRDSLSQLMNAKWDSLFQNDPQFKSQQIQEGEHIGKMPPKTLFE